MTAPPKPTLANILNLMTKPRCAWAWRARAAMASATSSPRQGVSDMSSLSAWTREQFDPKLDWNDVECQEALGRQAHPERHHGR